MAELKSCYSFAEVGREDVPLVGGKGANLGEMTRQNLPVPPGFVVCSHAYRQAVEASGIDTKIKELVSEIDYKVAADLQSLEGEIHKLFSDIALLPDLQEEILASYRALGADALVAVRSSATAEDLADASFAGQQETILNVHGEEALIKAIIQCWTSLHTSQAIFYRHRQGFDNQVVSMAVVVQKMVNSEKSGVTFTIDPVSKNQYNMVVEAVWGLGEGIVSGAITPDHYKVDREDYELVHEFIAVKKVLFGRNGSQGVVECEVPEEKVKQRVLSDEEIKSIVDLGNQLETHFGCPQDIEWGIENSEIYLLQSRAITTH